MDPRPTLVVAGATGFIGRAACLHLARDFRVIGLARRARPPALPGVEWRSCDLFSYTECEQALEGADAALYLVHSMLPSARLTQGTFQDMDLILADNFARAAARQGLRQIVYLGGLLPGDAHLSRHLASRLEVERTLGARGVPLAALRAGIVVGAHGSSFAIFRRLLARLSLVPCPRWSRSPTQPIALADVLALFRHCLEHGTTGTFDVGCPEVLTYRELLMRTARAMGLRRTFVEVPLRGSRACTLWLCAVTGAPRALVEPLVESMRLPMVARERRLQETATPLDAALEAALVGERNAEPADARAEPTHYDVRSVQRLPLPPGYTARSVAERYLRWLPWSFRWILHCDEDEQRNVTIALHLLGLRWPLLELAYGAEASAGDDRQVYFITGGALARAVDLPSRRPRLEFREVLGGTAVLMAIHDYRPALPPWFYERTQALAHLLVTRRFARHLERLAARRAPSASR